MPKYRHMPKKGSVKSVIPVVLVPSLPLFKPINPPINAIINKMRKPEASILFVFNHFSFGRLILLARSNGTSKHFIKESRVGKFLPTVEFVHLD